MKLERNWEIKADIFTRCKNLFKKGGFNPAFYLYRYRFNFYPKKYKVWKNPLDVIAETSNVCNLQCTMCFQTDDLLPVTHTTSTPFMEMDTFKRIVDECVKNKVPALKLNWRGEPMLNRHFLEMVDYAKTRGILELTSLTNATLMSEEVCRKLVETKMDQIIISIDGFTKETYEKIRVGADFSIVVSNINTLLRIRGRSKKPFIRLQFTESEVNRHETKQFYDFWENKVDEITISYCQEFGSPDKNDHNEIPVFDFCCKQPFQRLVFMTDGTACTCATDVMGSINLGNIKDSSLDELWHGELLNKIRELHKSGKYFLIPMCRICAGNVSAANKDAGR